MHGLCTICAHSQRTLIDESLRAGHDLRSLANEFALRTPVLRHHRDEHVAGLAQRRRRAPAIG